MGVAECSDRIESLLVGHDEQDVGPHGCHSERSEESSYFQVRFKLRRTRERVHAVAFGEKCRAFELAGCFASLNMTALLCGLV